METRLGKTKLLFVKGDITRQETEAIVNAANSGLLGGSGVDGAIHSAGGPRIMEECRQIRARQGGCPTGQAVITGGGHLKAKYVIHTVGPIWAGGDSDEDQLLRSAYTNSLLLAKEQGIKSVSFPSISTGAYGFPLQRAAGVAVGAVKDFLSANNFEVIRFVLFSDDAYNAYVDAWQK